MNLQKHVAEFRRAALEGDYERSDGGIVLKSSALLRGVYRHSVNGEDEREDANLIPDQGILYLLNAALGAVAKISTWYLAPFAGAVTPAANWTAANFTSTASEITSASEGYSEATRPAWTPSAAAAGEINNLSAKARITVVATTSINVNGVGLLSDSAKGGTAGVLASAARFSATRVLFNTDTFDIGYRISLTDS